MIQKQGRILLMACIGLLYVGSAWSQDVRLNPETGQREVLRFHVGAYGAVSINLHTTSFGALPGTPSCCPKYNNASTVTPALGGLLEIPVANNWRAQIRLGYSTLSGLLTDKRVIGNEPVFGDGPVPIEERRDVVVEYSLNATMPLIVLEPAASYKVLDLFWLYAGLRAGYVLGKSFTQREELVSPDGVVFAENGTTVRNNFAGEIPDVKPIQLHAALGLGYELNVSRDVMLVPEVRYFFPIHPVASVDWNIQSFQLGASIRYSLWRPVDATIMYDTVYTRDTVVVVRSSASDERVVLLSTESNEDRRREGDYEYRTVTIHESYQREVPRPFEPTMVLTRSKSNGDEKLGVDVIVIRETDVVESYPLLPQVFFDEGSADLATTRMQQIDAGQTRDFRTVALERDQFDVYHNILNIIGERMRRQSAAKITLSGAVNNVGVEKNNRALGQSRADAVRNYLVDVWGIDKSRISTTGRILPEKPANVDSEDGKVENRRVDIATNDPSILETVEFRDRDRSVDPKEIIFLTTVEGGEDIVGWSIEVTQKGLPLFNEEGSGIPHQIFWKTEGDRRPKLDESISVNLTVRNDKGQKKSLADAIPVNLITVQKAKSMQEGGKQIERYSLIVFDYNSAKLNESNQRVMDIVRSRVQPDSKVRIMGYADRTGDPEYNRKLAIRRCEEAKLVLNVREDQVSIEPVGSDRLIYDNDLPEGRSYCRTVQIEVETPIR